MGDKINNVQSMMNNPKQRNIYLMTVGVAIIALVGGFMYATSGDNSDQPVGSANVAKVPNGINSVPGTSDSSRYNTAVLEANKKEANKAIEEGKTYIPTVVNSDVLSAESPLDSLDKEIKAQKEAEAREQAEKQAQAASEQLAAQQAAQNSLPVQPVPTQNTQVVAPPVAPAPQPKPKQYGTDDDYLIMQAIHGVSGIKASKSEKDFFGRESNTAALQTMQSAQLAQSNTGNQVVSKGQLIAKAGTIFNAVLETNINSDEPSPVLAKIVSGDLKGTRLIGKISTVGEKVVVQFTTASIPEMPTSMQFNAVAIDPGTSRTALASNVDRHYFLKYGVLLGATFLGSYADSLANKNSTTTVTPEGSIVTTRGELSSKDMKRQALGTVGKELASDTRTRTQGIQPTITVNAGVPIGILITEDLYSK
jgi:type IV secretory pathway VirB10-like protein